MIIATKNILFTRLGDKKSAPIPLLKGQAFCFPLRALGCGGCD